MSAAQYPDIRNGKTTAEFLIYNLKKLTENRNWCSTTLYDAYQHRRLHKKLSNKNELPHSAYKNTSADATANVTALLL